MAGTTLQQGQIAIVQLNWNANTTSRTAGFEFVLLAPIAGGTTIGFTGAGFYANGTVANDFNNNPALVWTAPGAGLAAGSVVTFSEHTTVVFNATSTTVSSGTITSGNLYLDSRGYRVTAFQGTLGSSATLLYSAAVNGTVATQGDSYPYANDPTYPYWNQNPSLFSSSDFADASQLPTSLKGYEVAFDGTVTNGSAKYEGAYYHGPTSGSASQILAAINTAANWITQQSAYTGPSGNGAEGGIPAFTVSAAVTVPTVTASSISVSGATGNGGVYKIGDTVTATWNNSANGDNNSAAITGVTFDFTQFGGGAAVAGSDNGQGLWSRTYTITAGSISGIQSQRRGDGDRLRRFDHHVWRQQCHR